MNKTRFLSFSPFRDLSRGSVRNRSLINTSLVKTGLVVCLALFALAGCLTPSVPIPPPQPENMVFEVDADDGFATFSYDAQPQFGGSVVYVFNRDRGEGIITTARADGSVGPTQPFGATAGEDLLITFETEDQILSRCITLADGRSSSAFECSL